MAHILKEYKQYFKNKKFLISLGTSLLLFIISAIITYFAIIYATKNSSNPVTDIILSNIRVFNVNGIFIYGPIFFVAIITMHLLLNPKKIPFALKSIAIFFLIRSIFISMTHMGPFPIHTQITNTGALSIFATGNDLFFSGHTGLPFLMALLFWDNKYLRFFSLATSLFFGIIVLLGHLHYSIDVFAAFFISYAIFHIAKNLFKKDFIIFQEKL